MTAPPAHRSPHTSHAPPPATRGGPRPPDDGRRRRRLGQKCGSGTRVHTRGTPCLSLSPQVGLEQLALRAPKLRVRQPAHARARGLGLADELQADCAQVERLRRRAELRGR